MYFCIRFDKSLCNSSKNYIFETQTTLLDVEPSGLLGGFSDNFHQAVKDFSWNHEFWEVRRSVVVKPKLYNCYTSHTITEKAKKHAPSEFLFCSDLEH